MQVNHLLVSSPHYYRSASCTPWTSILFAETVKEEIKLQKQLRQLDFKMQKWKDRGVQYCTYRSKTLCSIPKHATSAIFISIINAATAHFTSYRCSYLCRGLSSSVPFSLPWSLFWIRNIRYCTLVGCPENMFGPGRRTVWFCSSCPSLAFYRWWGGFWDAFMRGLFYILYGEDEGNEWIEKKNYGTEESSRGIATIFDLLCLWSKN